MVINLDVLQSQLAPEGFDVRTASNGKDGINAARSMQPDAILLDLVMPGMSGFEVIESLRTNVSTRAIPIIVVTAKDLTSEDKRSLSGTVSTVFQRGSVGVTDLVEWLSMVVGKPNGSVESGAPAS